MGNGFKTAVVANALSHIKLLLFTEQNFSPKSTTSMTFQTGLHPTEEVREGAAKVLCLTFFSPEKTASEYRSTTDGDGIRPKSWPL